jgi:hypothetical protein
VPIRRFGSRRTPDQHVVATWATKTMLTMQGARPRTPPRTRFCNSMWLQPAASVPRASANVRASVISEMTARAYCIMVEHLDTTACLRHLMPVSSR